MNLPEIIAFSEEQNRGLLENFFNDIWGETNLWSHDLSHHMRVWNFAKELLLISDHPTGTSYKELCDKLIIACFLHDIGMSHDKGILHGQQSRIICMQFLEKYKSWIYDFDDLLAAIENHDNKNYNPSTAKNHLQDILNAADDLDAFGYIGIARYLEIYLARGISLPESGELILKNATRRFENFYRTFGFSEDLVQKHRTRYNILADFFNRYKEDAIEYQFGSEIPKDYCGVAEVFLELLSGRKDFRIYLQEIITRFSGDRVIRNFFCNVKAELSLPK